MNELYKNNLLLKLESQKNELISKIQKYKLLITLVKMNKNDETIIDESIEIMNELDNNYNNLSLNDKKILVEHFTILINKAIEKLYLMNDVNH